VSAVRPFFEDVDKAWVRAGHRALTLSVIGSTALMLQTDYKRITKDSDVIETTDLTPELQKALLSIAGADTELFKRHRLYIDIVPPGLPLLPQQPLWRPLPTSGKPFQRLSVRVLDIVDVVISKLKRFNANDRADVTAMVERKLVSHGQLLARFTETLDFRSWDEQSPTYARNFNAIERDAFVCEETQFAFPDWM
jgi:hypothetical protein